jgi:Acetyl-CoA dehydrogenase C-terminal like
LLDEVITVTGQLHQSGESEAVLANAGPYLEMFGHLVIGWMWLEQLIAAHGKEGEFYEGKRAAARYFRRWELLKVPALLSRIAEIDRTFLDTHPEWL